MERFDGKKAGTSVFYFGGYTYHRDKRPPSRIYRCSEKCTSNCRGTVQLVDGQPRVRTPHNMHPPSLTLLDELRFEREVLRRCRETLDTYDEIFREVSLLYEEAAVNITQIPMASSMYRARRAGRPAVPPTLEEFSRVLREYGPVQGFYRGCARSADGHSSLIFANQEMLERLIDAIEIYVDGTFRVVPGRPGACQLLVVYVRYMGVGFPVAFILCERRTTAVYEAVFRFLINLAPGLENRLQVVTSDYERAIIAAVRNVFPNARSRGCWFHYCKAVFKKWRSLLRRAAPKDILWQLMGIPLLPLERQAEALVIVEAAADRMAEQYPGILQMLHYFRRQWVPLGDVIAVGRAPTRTNNICETFNKYICGRLGGSHPNIWIFLRKLHTLMAGQNIDFRRLQRGERIRRGRRSRQRHDDARLAYQQEELDAGRLTVEEFLRLAVIPRHRRGMEAANFMLEAQGNDPEPAELPVRADFLPQANPEVDEVQLQPENEPLPLAIPGAMPQNLPAANIVERNAEPDDQAADLGFQQQLPNAHDDVGNDLDIDDDVADVRDEDILSSDDEDGDFNPALEPIVDIIELPGIPVYLPANVENVEHVGHEAQPAALHAPAAGENLVPLGDPAPRDPPNVLDDDNEAHHVLQPCSICFVRRPGVLYLDCAHLIVCTRCDAIHRERSTTCPMCRRRIRRRVKTFFA